MDTGKTSVKESKQTAPSSERNETNVREDITLLWKNFLLETSLHGCSPILKSQYFWLRRLLWLLFIATSASFLVVYVIDFYIAYNKHPFITKSRLERVKSLPLPAISICDAKYKKSLINNSDIFEDYFNVISNPFVQVFGPFNITLPSAGELDHLAFLPLEEVGIKKEDLILKAYLDGRSIDVASEFASLTSLFGQCLTYNMRGEDGEGGNINLSYGQKVDLILNISQEAYFPSPYGGMTLTFHDSKDLPTPSSILVSVVPGFMNRIYLMATKLKFLPRPYRSFGDEYCVESTKGRKGQEVYTTYGCIEECSVQYAVNQCNCTTKLRGFPGLLFSVLRGTTVSELSHRICTSKETKECIFPNMLKVFYGLLFQNNTICDCPQPCETIQYDVRTSLMTFPSKPVADFMIKHGASSSYQDLRDNYASIEILFDRMVLEHEEHVPEIEPGDIFAKLGGQMGLFLGASILTLLELFETLLLTLVILGKAVFGPFIGLKVGAIK